MDGPDHRPDATVWQFQDILCPSAEHEDLLPMHTADQVVEQWLVSIPFEPTDMC